MNNVLINGDCLEEMKKIDNKYVDFILVDLPYGQTDCKWDVVIDLDLMWIQIKRILKSNGQVAFFCTTKFGISLINSNPRWFRYDLVWKKSKLVGHMCANKMQLRSHEMIYIFHSDKKPKDLKWTYNPQKIAGKPYTRRQNKPTVYETIYGTKIPTPRANETGDRHPTSVIECKRDRVIYHSTQKPIELCEWLIKTYTNENDVVLDFTMGSGTTPISCINTNRIYIGIEKDDDIFNKTIKRIEDLKI
jgi:site-specific DNA-methyltransferase (adenine-specific)